MAKLVKDASHQSELQLSTPLLVDVATAAKLLSIGKRTLWTLTNSQEIRSVKIGRCVRYALADLHDYVNQIREGN